jgi:hypothetical protein
MTVSITQKEGLKGEKWVYKQLKHMGYDVQQDHNFYTPSLDLRIGNLPIEVKYANKTHRERRKSNGNYVYYPRWQWFIHPTSHNLNAELCLILVASDNGANFAYVMPGSVVNDRTQVQITSHPFIYNGWLAQWLNRWDVVQYLLNNTYQNGGPLYNQWSQPTAA